MPTGTIKEYDSHRGFGTITASDTNEELTVYANYITLNVGETMNLDQKVEFDIENNKHGNWAINVRILKDD